MPKVVVTDKKGLVQESSTEGGLHLEGADNVASFLTLKSANGTVRYLFIDNNGLLKIHSAAPGAAQDDGAVVGAQAAP